jgi:hypothetical protein
MNDELARAERAVSSRTHRHLANPQKQKKAPPVTLSEGLEKRVAPSDQKNYKKVRTNIGSMLPLS